MSLLRTATHMAVASSVHGRVRRRQARRWAAADQAAAAQAPAAPAAAVAPPVPAVSAVPDGDDAMGRKLDQLTQLGQLKAAGILTEAEFEAKKAVILAS